MSSKEQLAINGGEPICKESFPKWPHFAEETIQAAMGPLKNGKTNYWSGHLGMEFENKFAQWNGAKFGISVINGTAALHTAVSCLGIGPGDEVICPSYSFIASSFCILQAGAIPIFADVKKEDHTIDPADIEQKINKKTKAILVVHLYGIVCDMDPIMEIAKKHNLFVIEDCAQCFGGVYKGKKVGTIGNAGAFSFCQTKHFTTGGEGGCTITNDEDLSWKCKSFRDHGYNIPARLKAQAEGKRLPYIHEMVGFNYRMTEMQSAIGLKELAKLDSYHLKNRRRNGEMIIKALSNHNAVKYLPPHESDRLNAFWLFPITLNMDNLTCDIQTFVGSVAKEGVPVMPVQWWQSYREKAFTEHVGFGTAKFPFESKEYTRAEAVDYSGFICKNASWLEQRTCTFPVHPVYTEKHIQYMIKAFNKVADVYMR